MGKGRFGGVGKIGRSVAASGRLGRCVAQRRLDETIARGDLNEAITAGDPLLHQPVGVGDEMRDGFGGRQIHRLNRFGLTDVRLWQGNDRSGCEPTFDATGDTFGANIEISAIGLGEVIHVLGNGIEASKQLLLEIQCLIRFCKLPTHP